MKQERLDYYLYGSHDDYIATDLQPHGVLMAIDDNNIVIAVSENVEAVLQASPDMLLGASLNETHPDLVRLLADKRVDSFNDEWNRNWAVIVAERPGYRMIEMLPTQKIAGNILRERIKLFGVFTINEVAEQAVSILQEMLGWDRITFHQFFNGYGVVLAEATHRADKMRGRILPLQRLPNKMAPYGIRHIPNRMSHPVKIIGRSLDLHDVELASPAPEVVALLTNKKSCAYLRLDIYANDRLWGVIEAENAIPSLVGENVKVRLHILSYLIGQKISDLTRQTIADKKIEISAMLNETLSIVEFFETNHEHLFEMLGYSGIVYHHSRIFVNTWGEIKDANLVVRVAEQITKDDTENHAAIFCNVEDRFRELVEPHRNWFSCVTVIPISADNFVVLVRRKASRGSYESIIEEFSYKGLDGDVFVGNFLDRNDYCYRNFDNDIMEFLHARLISKGVMESRRTAEERARRSEQRYRDIIENQTDIVSRFSPDTTITFVNPSWEGLFGVKSFDAFGSRMTDYFQPSAQKVFRDSIRRMLEKKETETFTIEIDSHDGRKISLQWINRPLMDDQGNVIEFQAIARDVTDLVAIQRSLEERERRLSQAQRVGRFGDWSFDVEKRLIWLSATAAEMLGLTGPTTITSDDFVERVNPTEHEKMEHVWQTAIAQKDKKISFGINKIIHKDDSIRFIFSEGQIQWKDNNEVLFVDGIVQDRTEEQLVLQHLRESKDLVESIFNSAKVGIVMIDRFGYFVEVNKAFLDIYGYRYDEIVGQHSAMTIQMDDKEEYTSAHGDFIHGIRDFPSEWIEMTAQKRIIYTSVTASLYRDRAGDPFRISTVEDVTEKHRNADRISYMAHYDQLTGLPNRTLFNDRINQAISFASRRQVKLALYYIDLDHFKHINDTLGHTLGDRLLVEVAKRLRRVIKNTDTAARLGGDEYAIITYLEGDRSQASAMASQILEEMSAAFTLDNMTVHSGCSVGITIYPDDADTPEQLLKYADMAMFRAKKTGRQRFHYYNSQINMEAVNRKNAEDQLRRSLSEDRLDVHYQPKIALNSGEINGVEALLRWPQRTDSSDSFVRIAEESGLIKEVGHLVLRRSCEQLRDHALKNANFKLSVNVSPVQFQAESDFVASFSDIIKQSGFPPNQLILEITEHDVMHSSTSILEQMRSLNQLGIRFSVDDFGTGFSSMRYLTDFPISELKIDQSFVQRIENENSAAVVRAAISLGLTLGLMVVAEGVETQAQVDFLCQHQCDTAQGYFYSKALPFDDLMRFIEQH